MKKFLIMKPMKAIFPDQYFAGRAQEHDKKNKEKKLPPQPAALGSVLHTRRAVENLRIKTQGNIRFDIVPAVHLQKQEGRFILSELAQNTERYSKQQKEEEDKIQSPRRLLPVH